MLKAFYFSLLLLCGQFAFAQQAGPFDLGRIDLTPGEIGSESVEPVPFGDGHLIFNSTLGTDFVYYFDGTTVTPITGVGTELVEGVSDLGPLPGGRCVGISAPGTNLLMAYYLAEQDLSLTLLHETPVNFSRQLFLPEKLILYNDDEVDERKYLALGISSEQTSYLPVLGFPENPSSADSYLLYNDNLVIRSSNGVYITDGTPNGTELLADVRISGISRTLEHEGQLFFATFRDIYVSEGTAASTRLLTGPDYPANLKPTLIQNLTSTESGVVYTGRTTEHGMELFLTDGTAEGSSLLLDVVPGPADGINTTALVNYFQPLAGLFAFAVNGTNETMQLWQTDGTEAGTIPIDTMQNGTEAEHRFAKRIITELGDVYWEWVSTENGVYESTFYGARMTDARPKIRKLAVIPNGLLFTPVSQFVASDGWVFIRHVSRNSETNTYRAFYRVDSMGVVPEGAEDVVMNFSRAIAFGERIFAQGSRESLGREPISYSFGEGAFTVLQDVRPGSDASDPIFFTNGEEVFFLARSEALGFAVYRTDGTSEGTVLVTDLHHFGGSTSPSLFRRAGPYLLVQTLSNFRGWFDFSQNRTIPFPTNRIPFGESVGPYVMVNNNGPTVITNNSQWDLPADPEVGRVSFSFPVRWRDKLVFVGSTEVSTNNHRWKFFIANPYTETVETAFEVDNITYGHSEKPVRLSSDGNSVFFGFPDAAWGDNLMFHFDGAITSSPSFVAGENVEYTKNLKGLSNEIAGFQGDFSGLPEISIARFDPVEFATFQYPWNEEQLRAVVELEDYVMVMTDRQLSHSYDNDDLEEDEDDILLDDHNNDQRLASLTKISATEFLFLRQTDTAGEIWLTDGTSSGTRMINNYTGRAINNPDNPLPTVTDWLSLTLERPDGNRYLHVYDYRNNELYELAETPANGGSPTAAFNFEGRLYFLLTTEEFGREIHFLDFGSTLSNPGQVFADVNENGIRDEGELGISSQPVRIASEGEIYRTFSDESGAYTHRFLPETTYSYTVEPAQCWESVGSDGPIDTTATGFFTAPNFPLRPRTNTESVRPFLASGVTRCGFTVPFWLRAINTGCLPLNDVTVELALGNDGLFISAAITPDAAADGTYFWTGIPLGIGEAFNTELMVEMPDENRAGEELSFRVVTRGNTENGDLVTDTSFYRPTLRCAIDPNDKLVSPARPEASNSNYTQIDETLTYTIRFQNTGNDTALNVRLEDQLAAELDLKTFKPIAASHDYRVELAESGRLKVYFDDIFLPDSNVNEAASHGFFAFDIALKQEGLNTTVENTAGIFFDFNAPVITNTVSNSIVEFLDEDQDEFFFWEECDDQNPNINPSAQDIGGNGIDEDCDGEDWTTAINNQLPGVISMFPNPTRDGLKVDYDLPGELQVEVFDGRGRRMQGTFFKSSAQLDLFDLPAAIYLLKITDPVSGRFVSRRIVKR